MANWRRIVSLIAFAGFGAMLVLHLATFFGLHLRQNSLWGVGLFVGATLPIVLMAPSRGTLGRSYKEGWQIYSAPLPRWVRTVVIVFYIYAILNIPVSLFLTMQSGDDIAGQHFISGSWMILDLVSAFYFWYHRELTSETNESLH